MLLSVILKLVDGCDVCSPLLDAAFFREDRPVRRKALFPVRIRQQFDPTRHLPKLHVLKLFDDMLFLGHFLYDRHSDHLILVFQQNIICTVWKR